MIRLLSIEPTEAELLQRDRIICEVLLAIRENRVIKLPEFDRLAVRNESLFALGAIGESPSPYSGAVGPFRYHFEGEEDLLHLFVIRKDGTSISVEEAQQVASLLYEKVPKALIWLKPGKFSQHFYIGHDELLTYLDPTHLGRSL
jgi:hypothetical protein